MQVGRFQDPVRACNAQLKAAPPPSSTEQTTTAMSHVHPVESGGTTIGSIAKEAPSIQGEFARVGGGSQISSAVLPPRARSRRAPELTEVPRIAHAIWLHKSYSWLERLKGKGTLPAAYRANLLEFAKLNPDIPLTVWTDKVRHVKALFPIKAASNIRVREFREALRADEFPRMNEYIHGMRSVIPAAAKDVLSWKILRDSPGIAFDVDTKWSKPVPSPLLIHGAVAANLGGENRVVLFSGSTSVMDKVLSQGEAKSAQMLDRTKLANGNVELRVTRDRSVTGADIVNQIGFFPFQNYLLYQADTPLTSDRILRCVSPGTMKAWEQQGRRVKTLTVPARDAAGSLPSTSAHANAVI